jgi:uncharacterized protein (TIGR02594 family)
MVTNLKLGARGTEVQQIQLLLNSLLKPTPPLRPDGNFGPRTDKALREFQRLKSLDPDGVAGPRTRTALGLKATPTPTAAVSPPAQAGGNAPWLDIAVAELGVHEDSTPGKHHARIIEYHATTTLRSTTDETPWCSSFVNWVMKQAGIRGTGNALAKSWLDWGTALATPRPGAVTVIKRKTSGLDSATGSSTGFHVAFLISATPGHIRLLGGNQGDQVKYSTFNTQAYEVRGHRWPR